LVRNRDEFAAERAAWAHAHASDPAKKSPDFAPTRRASVFAGGLRRCGACQ
jgi:hypothetical protein